MTTAVVLMDAKEANNETASLKRALRKAAGAVEAIKVRLVEAESREIWKPLGYRSMGAYIAGEFGMSRSNAYRTLDVMHATLQLEAPKTVPQRDSSPPSQREAARIVAPLKQKRARRGPPSIAGWLQGVRDGMDRIDGAFEVADDDALAYLSHEDRRAFERTVTKAAEWAEAWADRLSAPVSIREPDEWGAA